MDIIDRAQERDLEWTHFAIRNHMRRRTMGDGEQIVTERVTPRICADCKDEIPLARLSAVPDTDCCTFCQGEREQTQWEDRA